MYNAVTPDLYRHLLHLTITTGERKRDIIQKKYEECKYPGERGVI